jgi:hypothetical protein
MQRLNMYRGSDTFPFRAGAANTLPFRNGANHRDTRKVSRPTRPAFSGTTEAERRHIASMGATGTAWGTAVQTILDAVGGLPSVGSPGLMPPRGGLEKEISTWNRNQPAAEEKQAGGYQAPPINPFYDVGPAPK